MRSIAFVLLFFFFVVPVGFFGWILSKGLKGAKSDEWEGEVTNKLYNTRREDNVEHEYYSIVFKTDKGERNIAVNKDDYATWKVGDKAKKIKGKFGVEKI